MDSVVQTAAGMGAWPAAPRAEIVAVGSELLTPSKTDTNSLYITEVLNELGIEVSAKMIVGDRLEDLMALVRHVLARVDLLVMTGGLGPTEDDLTRDAVARVVDKPLVEDPAIVDAIRARFERRGMVMPEINRRQAMVPEGATVIDNPNGTAPGLWIPYGNRIIILLPGPPREMRAMLRKLADGPLASRVGRERLFRRVIGDGRPRRIARRTGAAAVLCALEDVAAADRRDHPRGDGAGRTAFDGADGGRSAKGSRRWSARSRMCGRRSASTFSAIAASRSRRSSGGC